MERESLSKLLDDAELLLLDDEPSRMKNNLKDFEETIQLLPSSSDLTNAASGNESLIN